MIRAIVVATRNPGKVREFRRLLAADGNVVLADPTTIDALPEVVEDGETFEANAIKKAREVAEALGCPVLADDSGLEVDALEGAPGVYSARFAGPNASDAENNSRLLELLDGVRDEGRGARYRVVLAFADPMGPLGDEVRTVSGRCEGRIGRTPRGSGGFGYDPLFFPAGQDRSMAELSAAEKDELSHRGQAARALIPFLRTYFAR